MIKLIILDVDGVLSDGKKWYDSTGRTILKTFCDKDFTAIKKFKSGGCSVMFLSGDKSINEQIAKNRNIYFVYTRGKCKSEFLEQIKAKYNVADNEIAFMGDDTFDKGLMDKLKYSFCPSDAPKEVKLSCHNVLNNTGGNNCVLELYEYLLDHKLIQSYDMNKVYNIDKDEKW